MSDVASGATLPPVGAGLSQAGAPPAGGAVSLGRKALFGLGGLANGLLISGVQTLTMPVYNLILGVRPQWVGVATSIPLVYDAVTDPVMGWFSDNFRSRWGRRRPFILAGGILTGVSFAVLWLCPQSWPESSRFLYLLAASIVFYTAHKIWFVPYIGLGLGLTSDHRVRTSLWGFFTFCTNVASLSGVWLLSLIESPLFGTSAHGARVVGCAVGALTALFAVVPSLLVEGDSGRQAEKGRLLRDVGSAVRVKTFRQLAGTILLLNTALNCAAPFGVYVLIYFVNGGDAKKGAALFGVMSTAQLIAALLSLPVVTKLAHRFGKKPAMLGCLVMASVGAWSTLLTVRPDRPWLVVISGILIAPGAAAPYQLYWSMLMDVCDQDQLQSGLRREGTFSALGNWFVKTAQGVAFLATGLLMSAIGFDRNLAGHQPASAILGMRLIWAVVPGVVALVAFLVLWRYPITLRRSEEMRRELEARATATPA